MFNRFVGLLVFGLLVVGALAGVAEAMAASSCTVEPQAGEVAVTVPDTGIAFVDVVMPREFCALPVVVGSVHGLSVTVPGYQVYSDPYSPHAFGLQVMGTPGSTVQVQWLAVQRTEFP